MKNTTGNSRLQCKGLRAIGIRAFTGIFFISACGPNYVLQSEAKKKLGMSDQEIMSQELAESEAALAASGGRGAQTLPNTSYLQYVDSSRCDRYVDVAGSDSNPGSATAPWKTVKKALASLTAGQIACVRPGTYLEARPTTLNAGTSTAPIVVRAADPNNRPLLRQSVDGWNPTLYIDKPYWVIDGLRVDVAKKISTGVYFSVNAQFVTLRNSEIMNSAGGNGVSIQGKDLFLYKNFSHDHFKFDGEDSHAYHVTAPGARILLKDNLGSNNSGDAFQCEHYDNLPNAPYDITVEGGAMWNDPINYGKRTEQAVDIKQCNRITIRGVEIKQYRGLGSSGMGTSMVVHVGASNILIERNRFNDVETAANIFHDSMGVDQITVRYNIVTNIIKNAVSGKGGNGFNFGRGSNIEVYNNTFDRLAGTAITVGTVNWPATSGSTRNVDVFNNIIANSPGSIGWSSTTAPDMESNYNLFYNSPKPNNGREQNSLVANPMFLTDGSYRTASGSPARDSAFSISIPACSAGQNQVCYCGVRGDRGAMESDCGSVTQPTSSPTITPTVTPTITPTITPTVSPTVTPTAGSALPISGITGSAGTMVGGEAHLATDGDMVSYWACSGTTGGCHLTVDLGASNGVGGMEIAWHLGDQRIETFAIAVSSDGVTYSQVYSGRSSGTTLNFERNLFNPLLARYVRLIGYGNSVSAWNSVKELRVLSGVVSSPTSSPTVTPTASPTVTPTVTPTSTVPVTRMFGATADATVVAGVPSSNFGTGTTLSSDNSPVEAAYLMFSVSNLGGPVSSAKLRLYASDGTSSGPQLFRTATGWTESGITYNNRPATVGSVLGNLGAVTSGTWVEYDVTSAITGNGTYSFGLLADATDGFDAHSRQGTNKPQLIIVTSEGGTAPAPSPSPTLTSTPVTGSINFAVIGDFGNRSSAARNVSNLVKGWNPQFIITTGDNNYDLGEASTIDASIGQFYQQYIGNYKGSYGPGAGTVNRFFPSLGNHDWGTGSVSPYTNYFTLSGNERYYTFTQGPVQFFAIDSDPHDPDGTSASSTQAMWLKAQLAASTAAFKIVYFHHPSYSSGAHQSATWMRWPFREWGASIVFAGHEHSYERVVVSGFPYVIQGSGGAGLRSFGTTVSGSVYRNATDHGASKCTASATQLKCEFWGGRSDSTLGLVNLRLLDTVTLIK